VHTIIALAAPVPNAATAESTWRQGKRDRGMDDRLLEELCRWHDEQAALLRSEAGTLAAAAVAADMHAKTSAALHEAVAEIKRLIGCRAEPQQVRLGWQQQVRSQHQQYSRADLLVAGDRPSAVPGLADFRDAGLAVIRAEPPAI
jgi:hypothetical protein